MNRNKNLKAIIRVTRRTKYASIVEMPVSKYNRLHAALCGDSPERARAEKTLNAMIDKRDRKGDELLYLEEFWRVVEDNTNR